MSTVSFWKIGFDDAVAGRTSRSCGDLMEQQGYDNGYAYGEARRLRHDAATHKTMRLSADVCQACVAAEPPEIVALRASHQRLKEALQEAERGVHFAWQMLEAMCANEADYSRDRAGARDKTLARLDAVRRALKDAP